MQGEVIVFSLFIDWLFFSSVVWVVIFFLGYSYIIYMNIKCISNLLEFEKKVIDFLIIYLFICKDNNILEIKGDILYYVRI